MNLSVAQQISIWILPLLFAITLHEAAHAFASNYFGDKTAKMLGRMSLNPIKHIDLIGTILLPIIIAVLTQFNFVFGYAKPVPVNWEQLKNPRRDMAFVAFAGPLANIIMALIWALLLKTGWWLDPKTSAIAQFLLLSGSVGIFINLLLGCLNLLPIPPLDGSRIFASLMPPLWAYYYLRIEPYGIFIIMALLLTGVLGSILLPVIQMAYAIIIGLVGL